MSNYATLKAAIQSAVYTNGNNEITGAGLQAVLLQIVNTVGDGYVFAGVANTGTAAGTPDANVFYIAPAGTYTNFGGTHVVGDGCIGVFMYNGSWSFAQVSAISNTNPAMDGGCTDNDRLNAIFPYIYATSDIVSVSVTFSATEVYVHCYDAGSSEVAGRYRIASTIGSVFEVVDGSTTTDTDMLLRFNYNAYKSFVSELTGTQTKEISATLNASCYDYKDISAHFPELLSKDWGSTGQVGSDIGTNIYFTVDVFRFPVHIEKLTIPAQMDGVVDIYRSTLAPVGTETEIVATLDVKQGTHDYLLDIRLAQGEGLAFCANNIMRTYSTPSWRINDYAAGDLQQEEPVSGWMNGAMIYTCHYRFDGSEHKKPLAGMKVSILGDSISTCGATYSYSDPYYPAMDVLNYQQTWWGRLMQDGAVIIANKSESRATYGYQGGADAPKWMGYDQRIEALGSPDVIIVSGGVNDMYNPNGVGAFDFTKTLSDYGNLDTSVFKQAVQYVLMKLIDTYPTSKIFICTPMKEGNGTWGFPERNTDRYMKDICDTIREAASSLGVGMIDLYADTDITYSEMNALTYGNDIHPNKAGHYKYYKILRNALIDWWK